MSLICQTYAKIIFREGFMSTLTTGGSIEFSRSAAGSAAGATQTAVIAARLERLPMTSYQRGLFAIIATAWFFDSMDLGALTFVLGPIKQSLGLSPSEAGILSSMSFLCMFL